MIGRVVVLVVALSVWLILSAAAQLSTALPRLAGLWRYDFLGLVPRYHFFAPIPVQHDYYLIARTTDAEGSDGSAGPWHEVMGPPPRRWWHFAWNPDRRAYKSLCDLMQVAQQDEPGQIGAQLSVPYLAVLNHVTAAALAWGERGSHVQFVFAIAPPPRAVFKSVPHLLEGGPTGDVHSRPGAAIDGDPGLRRGGPVIA